MTLRVFALGCLAFSLLPAQPMRVAPEDLVVLEMAVNPKEGCGEAKLDFVRIQPDGGAASGYFRVPNGRLLVVTDVDWHYSSGAPGVVQILSLLIENRADPTRRRRVFESTIRLGGDGAGGTSEHMMTGFVINSAARICPETRNPALGSPLRLSKILLRGYLVNETP